ADVLAALAENQVRYRMVGDIAQVLTDCDALMMAPYDMSEIGEPAASGLVPPNRTPDSHIITAEKIERIDSRTLLYHPLPRLEEIHPSCDVLPTAMYFEQVRLSKFMRMAVLYRVLSAGSTRFSFIFVGWAKRRSCAACPRAGRAAKTERGERPDVRTRPKRAAIAPSKTGRKRS